MYAQATGAAHRRPEPEIDSLGVEAAAQDFGFLVGVLKHHRTRQGDDFDLSLARAQHAAERGLALCHQLILRRGR